MNLLGTKKLETERLILKRFEEKDVEEVFFGYINQKEFLYYANKKEMTIEEVANKIKNVCEKYKNNDYFNWCIVSKEDNKIIGAINLKIIDIEKEIVQVNYAIDNRYTNKGFMTECLNEILRFSFDELKVKRFNAGVEVLNKSSEKVLLKCGFKLDKVYEKYLELKDGFHDMKMYYK